MFRLLFLGNSWADFVGIWYALGNPLVTAYAVVTVGVSLHVRTCRPRFCISGTAWPIEFNFGVCVSSPYRSAFHKSWVGYLCTCVGWDISARAHVHPISHHRARHRARAPPSPPPESRISVSQDPSGQLC